MIKKDQYTYLGGMNVDMPPAKRGKDQYVILRNGRITSSYSDGDHLNIPSNGIVRCQSGNELSFEFTSIEQVHVSSGSLSVQYKISGSLYLKTFAGVNSPDIADFTVSSSQPMSILTAVSDGPYAYFLTTTPQSVDCIWKHSEVGGTELLYINNLGWNNLAEKNFDIVVNIENESVIKMYIADGKHQIFSVNIASIHDLSKPRKVLYMVPQYTMSQPYVSEIVSGGEHTSGAIQYAYNLFNVNGGQTKISPASELIYIGKYLNGGDVNEVVGQTNIIKIEAIDTGYDYIRIYSIKYNDLDTTPIVSVIGEYASPGNGILTITDDGRVKYNISIESLIFLGGTEIIPRCIIAKKNRLLLANIVEDIFDLNWDFTNQVQLEVNDSNYFDSRAYSSNVSGYVAIWDKFNIESGLNSEGEYNMPSGDMVPEKHDCVQDKNIFLFHPQYYLSVFSDKFGGDGRHVSYKIKQTNLSSISAANYDPIESRYMKVGEVYRWAIEFYDNQSRKSTPHWIADVKVPPGYYGTMNDTRVTIEFTINAAGISRLAAQGIVGYKFLRVQRQEADKTIVAQGIITPMIFQLTGQDAKTDSNQTAGNLYSDINTKITSPWIRHMTDQVDIPYTAFDSSALHYTPTATKNNVKIYKLQNNKCISPTNPSQGLPYYDRNIGRDPCPFTEIYRDRNNDPVATSWLHISYQDTRLMQLFSPETIFGTPNLSSNMKLRTAMTLRQDVRSSHGKMIYADTSTVLRDRKDLLKTNLFDVSKWGNGYANDVHDEKANFIHYNGYIGPNRPYPTEPGLITEQFIQYYRSYVPNTFLSTKGDDYTANDYSINGIPELTNFDSSVNTYNELPEFKYTNSLQNVIADGSKSFTRGTTHPDNEWDIPIYGVDAIAAKNITFTANIGASFNQPYETIVNYAFASSSKSINPDDHVLLGEIVADIENQYGGKYYEDRSVNKYMAVGVYQKISGSSPKTYNIINSGDVFVGNFLFARIARIDGASLAYDRLQMSEIVKIPVETTINLRQRSDSSYGGWTAQFLPTNDQFHKYNSVYSQESNVLYSIPDPFLFVRNTKFSNRIMATKPKIAGEIIDSWTDILVNEEIYLEGEYGRINRMIKFNDNLYVFQRDGVAAVSVLPRVQVSGSDAVAIELGLGQVLSTYQYINTNSGCDDFNGIVSTSSATYYGDRIRRTINIIEGITVSGMSDTLGMSQYIKGYDTNMSVKPSYVLGFNPITDDVYITIRKQKANISDPDIIETLVYDEGIKRFTAILDMPAEFVFTIDSKLHSIGASDSNKNKVWTHFIGNKSCNFYGVQYPLELTICMNPEGAENDNIFNSIEWTHDIVNTTDPSIKYPYEDNITGFESWSDYQRSTAISTISAIKRRFRMSRIYVPRAESNNFDRMRGHYLFVKLTYLPDDSDKTILLNDLILMYNAQR